MEIQEEANEGASYQISRSSAQDDEKMFPCPMCTYESSQAIFLKRRKSSIIIGDLHMAAMAFKVQKVRLPGAQN